MQILEREVWGSNLGPVKSDPVLPTARHRCDISKGAVLPGRNDAEMGPANSLHASAYYSEHNERFALNMQIRGVYNCTTCDWLGCTIVRFVTHLVKTYTLYVFIAAVWGWTRPTKFLWKKLFFNRNLFWFSLFMHSRVE